MFIVVPLYYSRKKNYDIITLFRFKPVAVGTLLYACILGLSLTIITDEIDRLIRIAVPPSQAMQDLMAAQKINGVGSWILMAVGSVFLSPLAEEGLFRGFLQVSLENKGDVTRAVLLTSVSWALIYMNPYWAIPVFVYGIFLGYLSWKTKSIWPPVTMHAVQSFIGLLFLIEGFEKSRPIKLCTGFEESIPWYTMAGHVSPVLLAAAVGGGYYAIKMLGEQKQY